MRRCIIRARAVATEGRPLEDKLIVLSGKRIESILPSTASHRFSPKDFISNKRYLVTPGLIDIHVHGGGGSTTETLGGLLAACYYHASQGTTAILPTIFFKDLKHLRHMAGLVKEARNQAPCHILGINLEGPHINPDARGAMDKKYVYKLSEKNVDAIVEAGGGEIRIVTVAPEMPGAETVIKRFVELGVIVSLGHSMATSENANKGIEWGAKMVTHLGNAMSPFHQREPGLIGVALHDRRLIPEIIADGHHLAEDTVKMFLKATENQALLVSDCRWVGGLAPGNHQHEDGQTLTIEDGVARLPDGTFAGGTQALWHCLRYVAQLENYNLWQALPMASRLPAKLLGKRILGKVSVGGRADLVLAGPDLTVKRVFFGGEEIYRAQGEAAWT